MSARQLRHLDRAKGADTFRGTAFQSLCDAGPEGLDAVLQVQLSFIPGSTRVVYNSAMIRSVFTALAVMATGLCATDVDARELDRAELRQNVQNGRSMSFAQLVDRISALLEGDVMDVRAFDFGGIYYRVLVKQADGRLVAVVLDAATGDAMSTRSPIAAQVMAAASQGDTAKAAHNAASENPGTNEGNALGHDKEKNEEGNRGRGGGNNGAGQGSDRGGSSGDGGNNGGGGGSNSRGGGGKDK